MRAAGASTNTPVEELKSSKVSNESVKVLTVLGTFTSDIQKHFEWYGSKVEAARSFSAPVDVREAARALKEKVPGSGKIDITQLVEKMNQSRIKKIVDKTKAALEPFKALALSRAEIQDAGIPKLLEKMRNAKTIAVSEIISSLPKLI